MKWILIIFCLSTQTLVLALTPQDYKTAYDEFKAALAQRRFEMADALLQNFGSLHDADEQWREHAQEVAKLIGEPVTAEFFKKQMNLLNKAVDETQKDLDRFIKISDSFNKFFVSAEILLKENKPEAVLKKFSQEKIDDSFDGFVQEYQALKQVPETLKLIQKAIGIPINMVFFNGLYKKIIDIKRRADELLKKEYEKGLGPLEEQVQQKQRELKAEKAETKTIKNTLKELGKVLDPRMLPGHMYQAIRTAVPSFDLIVAKIVQREEKKVAESKEKIEERLQKEIAGIVRVKVEKKEKEKKK